ncbi:probable adenylate kinase 6, chloroplastic isoform X2 [Hevea brasiliensis]|uniref:probable adenylate kinase 6, chloroplastic isoform X2 n=1 Tax=Hevea brasiliensis TaxID=3981 RepID=UPI000B783788|nr:probable adenylate kinase 6, chloroplastic isoform X2 [Hevea brasiliensis]
MAVSLRAIRNIRFSSFLYRALSSSLSSGADLKSSAFFGHSKSLPLRAEPKDRNVQWVFLGCPGVGKGTYASRLSNLLGVPHIATGDLVREELNSSGPLASQEILEGVTDIDLVVNLKLQEEALLAKCLGRRICSECGGNYNVASIDIKGENGKPGMYMAPLLPPPHCASKLIQRSDDTEEVVKERLRVYNEMSRPVEEFYRQRGKLLEFTLPGGIPESWPKLLQALNLEDPEVKQSAAA